MSPTAASTRARIAMATIARYAFDPGLSQQFEMAAMNEIVFRGPWETLEPGPVWRVFRSHRSRSTSKAFYAPVEFE